MRQVNKIKSTYLRGTCRLKIMRSKVQLCTSCSKWRILPPDANAATLHVQWTCGVGFESKPNFDSDTPYDLDMPHQDLDHHQKLQAPCQIVKTVKVTLQDDEQL